MIFDRSEVMSLLSSTFSIAFNIILEAYSFPVDGCPKSPPKKIGCTTLFKTDRLECFMLAPMAGINACKIETIVTPFVILLQN